MKCEITSHLTFTVGVSGCAMMQDTHSVLVSETPTRLNREITSIHFLERARHYRYAAALADDPQNIQRFLDLAFMFKRLAQDFARLEAKVFFSTAVTRYGEQRGVMSNRIQPRHPSRVQERPL